MESKNLFGEMPREERYKAMQDICVKTDFQKVRRHYNEDEKAQIKDYVAGEMISLIDRKDEFSVIRKEFNEACKSTDKELRKNLGDLKRGYSENEEDVFLVDDQESGLMHHYDRDGVFLYSRALFPEERQTRTIELNKAS